MELLSDSLRLALRAPKEAPHVSHQLQLGARPLPPPVPVEGARLLVRGQPRLVEPVDLGPFPGGELPNGRILHRQPPPDGLGVLLVAPPEGLLRGEAPARQIPPHRPDRQPQAELPANRLRTASRVQGEKGIFS